MEEIQVIPAFAKMIATAKMQDLLVNTMQKRIRYVINVSTLVHVEMEN